MKRRVTGYGVWLLMACCLYFFENQTATRIILGCSLVMPFLPLFCRLFFSSDRAESLTRRAAVKPGAYRAEDEIGDLKPYAPGDPVNRIHWKLSAKKDELLIRQPENEEAEITETEKTVPCEKEAKSPRLRHILWGLLLFCLALAPLFLIPEANRSLQALLNSLFEESERLNAYVYGRFPVSPEQSVLWAAVCLSLALAVYLLTAAIAKSRLMLFFAFGGCALCQIYFGLPLPGWLNAGLFAAFSFCMAARPLSKKAALSMLSFLCAVSLLVFLFWPGVDEKTEAASEKARDWLSQTVQQITGVIAETPESELETRHTHTQTLASGDREAVPAREYRLLTEEEAQISRPRWIDYLKIALLLLLAVALLIIPFLPFLLINARRNKALKARSAFESENVNEAVCAIFQQVIAWLEATGNSGGNLPYAAWTERAAQALPEGCGERFRACAKAFEEAAYSDHPLEESQREAALNLLSDTAKTLFQSADWKQKLRLQYKECLWP